MTDPNVHVFTTGADLYRRFGVVREIAVSWPPPRFIFDALDHLPAGTYIHWNTRASGSGEPITLVLCGDGEVTVRYHEPEACDIWQTDPQELSSETSKGRTRWSNLKKPRNVYADPRD